MGKKEKIQLVFIGVVVIGTALFLWLRGRGSEEAGRNWITRPENGTKQQTIVLTVGETEEEWKLEVKPRVKTEEEIELVFSETIQKLKEMFGIQDGERILLTDSIVLPQYIPETGADIRWDSSDRAVLSKDGKVQREHLREECEVNLQARISYGEEDREFWFTVAVPPYEDDSKEALLYGAQESLEGLERETSGEEGFYLPEEVGAVVVGLPEASGPAGLLVVLVLFLPFAVVVAKRQEKEKGKKRRAEELLTAYPQLITKLTLYTGAGLSLRGAWERLGAEYRLRAEKSGQRDAVSEEVLLLTGELKNGTSEAKAYEAFGKRIALKPYLRCASLLISQLQKGSGGLRKGLENEVQLAWEMHREDAARKGEEAQTKMLFPMMGMMFLVMAVVMVPAFFSM